VVVVEVVIGDVASSTPAASAGRGQRQAGGYQRH